jgi:glycosyltransferase involved in cell wall biosynthesis
MAPIRAVIACPGLGVVNRGYESFARECFDALVGDRRLDLHLVKGGGSNGPREQAIWLLDRRQPLSRLLGRAMRRSGYYVEQISFVASLAPYLARLRPDVVLFSDVNLRTPLWHWRQLSRLRYRLLLSNGGPVGPPFPRCEHVHQVLPWAVEEAVQAGLPRERQTFVPYGFAIPDRLAPLPESERQAVRNRLGLPLNSRVLLSVGALNASHKRMDHVIQEVAMLSPPSRPYLVLLGHAENETPGLLELGRRLLGPEGFWAGTVPPTLVAEYYWAADAFVLASLAEGFGRVYVEALSAGLPCLAHDYPAARFALAEHGRFADLRVPGSLANLIRTLTPATETERQAFHRSAYERFSWARLQDDYVSMIQRCAAERPGQLATLVSVR